MKPPLHSLAQKHGVGPGTLAMGVVVWDVLLSSESIAVGVSDRLPLGVDVHDSAFGGVWYELARYVYRELRTVEGATNLDWVLGDVGMVEVIIRGRRYSISLALSSSASSQLLVFIPLLWNKRVLMTNNNTNVHVVGSTRR
jgi:hypothetical protein